MAKWKKQVIEQLPEIFSSGRVQREEHDEALRDHLYQQIGQLKVELDWLKKNLGCSVRERLRWIEPKHRTISIKRQCELAALSRSSYYRKFGVESALNLELMRVLDELYTEMPYYGIRRMSAELRARGYAVNHKRVAQSKRKPAPPVDLSRRQELKDFHVNTHKLEVYDALVRND